jgi:hypothetical protein
MFWLTHGNKKACKYMIYRLLVFFDYSISGDQGTPFEHLEGILSVIREVYKDKKNKSGD